MALSKRYKISYMNNQCIRIGLEVMTQVRKQVAVITVSNSEGLAFKSQSRDELRISWVYSIPKANYRDNTANEITTASSTYPPFQCSLMTPITRSCMV